MTTARASVGHDRPEAEHDGGRRAGDPHGGAVRLPADLDLTLVSRRPPVLAEATVRVVAALPVSAAAKKNGASDGAGRVSVIIVTFNNFPYTKMCLTSVLSDPSGSDFEVIVVDNGSTDDTDGYLRQVSRVDPRVRTIVNTENRGFAAANNQGLSLATGNVLFLLNNDTIVPPEWLTRLARHLEDPAIGAVGPVTNRIGNEAEVETSYRTYGEFLDAAERRGAAEAGQHFDIPTPCMFCLALRRDAYERIGPLDEGFGVGLLEDDDYALRTRAAGYRTVCAEDVLVHHFGQASFGGLVSTGEYGRLLETNKRRFEGKWGRPWQPYGRRSSPAYDELKQRLGIALRGLIRPGARVLVVSRGDDELLGTLEGNGARACHFPQGRDGSYAGFYPANSSDAISHLEDLRARGAHYLLIPATAFWWLDHYREFGAHLQTRHTRAALRDTFVLYALRERDGHLSAPPLGRSAARESAASIAPVSDTAANPRADRGGEDVTVCHGGYPRPRAIRPLDSGAAKRGRGHRHAR